MVNVLPVTFVERLRKAVEKNKILIGLEDALYKSPTLSIRLHSQKGENWLVALAERERKEIGIRENLVERVPWCENGFYLKDRLSFILDPLFHAGLYYVQEAGSMFLEQIIREYVKLPVKCLDLCAAPGGKTTHLLNLLPQGSLLVANEVISSRCAVLEENLTKWGISVVVTHNRPEEIGECMCGEEAFDVIVADVPCSGEGMFRKDKGESVAEWNAMSVDGCAARQRKIVKDVWEALREGGLFVYSTCTYTTEENEDIVRFIVEDLGAEALPVPLKEEWKISSALSGNYPLYRFFPHRTRSEGFSLAVLRKVGGSKDAKIGKRKGMFFPSCSHKDQEIAQRLLSQKEDFVVEQWRKMLYALPRASAEDSRTLLKRLRVRSMGICLGELKGRNFVPTHSLAMSTILNPSAFPTIELTGEMAIRYLRKEDIVLPERTALGYVLLRFEGVPLGFVKHLGIRTNNLYPSNWRIRVASGKFVRVLQSLDGNFQ
ncbi:MAG: RsmF rRNA methyltransferase first C-terminal domain-containing protein [Tannerellaceae bacterium]|jgi:16S rRNA C967 or C1407 C5-methylase (RsmB/RsmF family)/NOL1/NOP2/fmu family ribosome biogenesis protein|nr:RsmF rRNA methyltransferase first C-terminal domain-containing protein [Tannerellaceae bacterium]